MPNRTGSGAAICPFYRSENEYVIRCQGMIEDTTLSTRFPDRSYKDDWEAMRCWTFDYKRCPVARALMIQEERCTHR